MGYVEQFDAMFKQDSAYEAVEFAATLKLPESVSASQREMWIEQIFEMLEMTALRNTEVAHMTVEQRKRLNIAVELAGNPAILFLDGNRARSIFCCYY
jgi:ABC-type multidrug transport system ATPase subunit